MTAVTLRQGRIRRSPELQCLEHGFGAACRERFVCGFLIIIARGVRIVRQRECGKCRENCFDQKIIRETLNKWIPLMVRCFVRLSITTNGINNLPFVLSLSKDLFSASLGLRPHIAAGNKSGISQPGCKPRGLSVCAICCLL